MAVNISNIFVCCHEPPPLDAKLLSTITVIYIRTDIGDMFINQRGLGQCQIAMWILRSPITFQGKNITKFQYLTILYYTLQVSKTMFAVGLFGRIGAYLSLLVGHIQTKEVRH